MGRSIAEATRRSGIRTVDRVKGIPPYAVAARPAWTSPRRANSRQPDGRHALACSGSAKQRCLEDCTPSTFSSTRCRSATKSAEIGELRRSVCSSLHPPSDIVEQKAWQLGFLPPPVVVGEEMIIGWYL